MEDGMKQIGGNSDGCDPQQRKTVSFTNEERFVGKFGLIGSFWQIKNAKGDFLDQGTVLKNEGVKE